jgi:pyroglutamyl-peptidase
MSILLTGFLPFLNYPSNPSERLVTSLQKEGMHGIILPVSYAGCAKELDQEIKSFHPNFILSFGYAGNRKLISLEKKAYNLIDCSSTDSEGIILHNHKIKVEGKDSLTTTLPLLSLKESLSSFPITISTDPGRYCCNEVYYLDLYSGIPSLFVHLPNEKEISLETEISFAHELIKKINQSL